MKKFIVILLICTLAIFLAGCESFADGMRETVAGVVYDVFSTNEYDMRTVGTFPDEFIGTWLWMDSPYYVFEAGGTGTMSGNAIHWTVSDGVLLICSTPRFCGGSCTAPTRWNYVLDGDHLTLSGRILVPVTFNYVRQR